MWRLIPLVLILALASCSRERVASPNADSSGLAIGGYDPVSYHTEGKARQGLADFRVAYQGAIWYFSSEANRATFEADPASYVPAYGGWCAYAMADGEFVDVDPERFLVTDGRLFLFYNGTFGDTLKPWQENPQVLEAKADGEWMALKPGT